MKGLRLYLFLFSRDEIANDKMIERKDKDKKRGRNGCGGADSPGVCQKKSCVQGCSIHRLSRGTFRSRYTGAKTDGGG